MNTNEEKKQGKTTKQTHRQNPQNSYYMYMHHV